jgi:hypothetical protein
MGAQHRARHPYSRVWRARHRHARRDAADHEWPHPAPAVRRFFELEPNVPHDERYGAEGAAYWVARKN